MNNPILTGSPMLAQCTILQSNPVRQSDDLNRLLCTAVVNRQFRHKLLNTPRAAVIEGHNGNHFRLTELEFAAISGIKEKTLSRFASELMSRLSDPEEIVTIMEARAPVVSWQRVY
jgi:hypothetical protein